MKVRELMTTEVKSCPEYSTLNTAAQMMWDHDLGCVPVIDRENHVIGIVTDRDICMSAHMQGVALTGALVTSAMSKQVFSCRPEDEIAIAEKLMREKQVHRLPVIDAQGHLVGVLSVNDIAREAAQEGKTRKARQVTDLELTQLIASVNAPRHRIIAAAAA